MKVTNQELYNIWEIVNQLVNADIPSFAGSCRIAEVYEKMKVELQQFIKFRDDLLKEYFNVDDKGIVQKIKDIEKVDEFNSKLNSLLTIEKEVDEKIYSIKRSYLKDIKILVKNEKNVVIDKISMPPMFQVILKPFIESDIKE